MYCQDSLSILFPKTLLKISLSGIETEPKLTLMKTHRINKIINIKKENLYVFAFGNYSNGLKKKGS